jgi:putative inorganic carbon (HCO3(-)) transporter
VKSISYINRSIEYLFYALLLFVPLIFAGNTSELFEFNKMWLTFGITALISALWLSKMVLLKRVVFKRTIFDIPILLFLSSQIVSTLLSLDSYVSFWGYYSRWNGGLLSIICYVILYYAFVSNFFTDIVDKDWEKKSWLERNPTGAQVVKRSIFVSLISGLIVVIWSLPAHFGYDPTCLIFRGKFDVSCWTADFQPLVRIFGPLGQPDWLAGYVGVLLPITLGYIFKMLRKSKNYLNPYLILYTVSFFLFYATLLYTGSRSGMIASFISLFAMTAIYILINRKNLSFFKDKFLASLLIIFILVSFFAQIRLPVIDRFSVEGIKGIVRSQQVQSPANSAASQTSATNQGTPAVSALDSGGSSSLQIRKIVWKGGLDAWRANPIFGTGVETFAYAYYKFRPAEHNLVSEWNFLYNKAHNEYINYLTTTGLFGLLTYMSFILFFIFIAVLNILNKKVRPLRYVGNISAAFTVEPTDPMTLALLFSFVSILIINFFGFSVVILNIYLFMIPAFAIIRLGLIKQDEFVDRVKYGTYPQWIAVGTFFALAFGIIWILIQYWIADTSYALGQNYDHAQDYQTAYPLLQQAVAQRKEPVFEDELSVNEAILALGLAQQAQQQKSSSSAQIIQQLANNSLAINDQLIKDHPNNVLYFKSRVRILYSLSALDSRFLPAALSAIKAAANLAPTDASILYNLGVLYGQNGDSLTASKILEQTISYKPDYKEAHFALALFYHDLGVDAKTGRIKDESYHQKAIEKLNYILTNLDPNYQQAKTYLDTWEKEK